MPTHWIMKKDGEEIASAWTRTTAISIIALRDKLTRAEIDKIVRTHSFITNDRQHVYEIEQCNCLYPQNHWEDSAEGLRSLETFHVVSRSHNNYKKRKVREVTRW